MDNLKSILFSKSEINYILNCKVLSKSFEYKIKSTIKRKINKLLYFELPLLIENGLIEKQMIESLISNTSINIDMLPRLGKEKVAGSNPAQGFDSSLQVPSNKITENVENISFSADYVSKGNRSTGETGLTGDIISYYNKISPINND